MNITFLIIFASIVIAVYLLQNLLGIRMGKIDKLFWYAYASSLLILLEALVSIFDIMPYIPHSLFLTLPLKFIIAPLFLIIILKPIPPKKIPPVLTQGYAVPTAVSLLLLLPIYTMDAPGKLGLLGTTNTFGIISVLGLLVSNILFLLSAKKALSLLLKKPNKYPVEFLLWGIAGFTSLQLIALVDSKNATLLDAGSALWALFTLTAFSLKYFRKTPQSTPAHLPKAIQAIMEKERLFLKPDLTLKLVAEQLQCTPNEVSKAINTGLSKSFNDFINEYRVDEVVRLLQDKDNERFTLEGIAKMAGFNSTTSFNKHFKRVMGKTPKQFKMMTKS